MAIVEIELEDDEIAELEAMFEALGIDMETAVNMFLEQVKIEGRMPFEVEKSCLEIPSEE